MNAEQAAAEKDVQAKGYQPTKEACSAPATGSSGEPFGVEAEQGLVCEQATWR